LEAAYVGNPSFFSFLFL